MDRVWGADSLGIEILFMDQL